MKAEYAEILIQAKSQKKELNKKLKRLALLGSKKSDELVHPLQGKITEEINCLDCANCCKSTSPLYRDIDIKRVSKSIGLRERVFSEKHLFLDDDGYYALKKSPCLFLQNDNCCEIYPNRPLACREFPHTDRENFIGILKITQENIKICPIVAKLMLSLRV